MKNRRIILGVIPIIAYGGLLILWVLWYNNNYEAGWDAAGVWALFFLPYYFGGAFFICLFLGWLSTLISKNTKIFILITYFLLLTLLVYFYIWLEEAAWSNYGDDTLFNILRNGTSLLYPLEYRVGRTVLLENIIGFFAGSLFQIRRNRLKLNLST